LYRADIDFILRGHRAREAFRLHAPLDLERDAIADTWPKARLRLTGSIAGARAATHRTSAQNRAAYRVAACASGEAKRRGVRER